MKSNIFAYAFTTLSFVAGSAAAFSGCSSVDATSAAESDDAYRKTIQVPENWSNLTIQLPAGTCQPGGSCSKPLGAAAAVTIDGLSATLGSKNRLKPGDHEVGVNGVAAKISLTGGQDKTLTLPVAHRKCVPATLPTLAKTDFGMSFTLMNATCPTATTLVTPTTGTAPTIEVIRSDWNCGGYPRTVAATFTSATTLDDCQRYAAAADVICSYRFNGTCQNSSGYPSGCVSTIDACTRYVRGDYSPLANGKRIPNFADDDRAFLPGNYEVSFDTGSGTSAQNFTLRDGETKEIPVNLPIFGTIPATFTTEFTFNDPRALQDGQRAQIRASCGESTYALPSTAATTLTVRAFQNPSCVYTLYVGGREVQLDQTRQNNIKLNRIDVDNIEVTREDGSKYTVVGQYEIYFNGSRVVGPVNTNTGVDVLPGTYELVTTYRTADGPQVDRETIQL